MRIIISVAVTVLAATFMPARAQDTCYVVECWPIPGGQRCHHRCFHPQPQYYAPAEDDDSEPVYQEPDYETPAPQFDEEPTNDNERSHEAQPDPPPQDDEPAYERPREMPRPYPVVSAPPDPAFVAGLFAIIVMIVLIVFGSAATKTAVLRRKIVKAEKHTTTARDLTRHAESTTQEIDAFVEDSAQQHFQRGRDAADREWTDG